MNDPERFDIDTRTRRLLVHPGWAAAGGLAGLCGFEAEGAMICFDPGLTLTPESEETGFTQVDINGDGLNDVGLGVGTASIPDGNGNSGMVHAGGLFGAQVAFTAPFPSGVPGAFYAGAAIGSGLGFSTAIGTLAFSSGGFLGDRGMWLGGNDAYFGVMFEAAGMTLYGWVHALWDADTKTLTIDHVGYEDTGAAAVIPGGAPFPMDLGISPASGAGMDLRWQVEEGFTYELERSEDMNAWSTIHTVTPDLCGEAAFVDVPPPPANGTRYYYRVKRTSASLLWLALGMPGRRRRMSGPANP